MVTIPQPIDVNSESELRGILVQLDRGELLGKGGVNWALKEIIAWHHQQLETKVAESELHVLQNIENMGDGEAKRQGKYSAHNMDGYHRAYGEAVAHNVHERITQLTPNPTHVEEK